MDRAAEEADNAVDSRRAAAGGKGGGRTIVGPLPIRAGGLPAGLAKGHTPTRALPPKAAP